MKLKDTVIFWDMDRGEDGRCAVYPLGMEPPEFRFAATTGGVYRKVHTAMKPHEARLFILSEALAMIVRDGLNPQVVHEALLNIDEYIESIPEDMPFVHNALRRLGK